MYKRVVFALTCLFWSAFWLFSLGFHLNNKQNSELSVPYDSSGFETEVINKGSNLHHVTGIDDDLSDYITKVSVTLQGDVK